MNGMHSPQKENNDYQFEYNQRNQNRQFFQKQQSQQGSQSNLHSFKSPPPLPNNQNNYKNQNINNNGNNLKHNDQNENGYNYEQQKGNTNQPQAKSSSVTNRRKIFAQDEDAQSIISLTNKQNNQFKPNQQQFMPLGVQKQGINQQIVQPHSQEQNLQQNMNQQNIQQQQNGHNNQLNYQNKKQSENGYQNQSLQEMYSDLLKQYTQLKELNSASEETHNLEIEDTKKHFEYKLQESQKKQQELVVKMQSLQQTINQSQIQIKELQEEIKNKDDHLIIANKQSDSSDQLKQEIKNLSDKKDELEKIIKEGKQYIEQIKAQSEDKSNQIARLQQEIQGYHQKYNHSVENLEINQNNCNTMRSEIQQLIASNIDLQKKVLLERKEKDDKVSEYQRILSRVSQNYTIKNQEEENQKRIADLEASLKSMIEKNRELNAEIKEKLVYTDTLHSVLKEKGVTLSQIRDLQNGQKGIQIKLKNMQGLSQITEEQEEDSYLDIPRRIVAGGDINTQNIEELRNYTKYLLDEIENLKNLMNSNKNKYSLISKENDILRANSQLASTNPSLVNGSSQTYLDRIKELNNHISQLQKDKETLIYENTVIVNQMKKERQNREDEVKLLQNQIKNYQILSNITSPTTTSNITNSSQTTSSLQLEQQQSSTQQLSTLSSQQQHATYHPQTFQQQLSNSYLPAAHKVISSKNQTISKPPIGLIQQHQQQQQLPNLSNVNAQITNDQIVNSINNQKIINNSQQIVGNQIQSQSTMKRATSYDGNLSSLYQQNQNGHIGHPISYVPQIQQNSPTYVSHLPKKEENDKTGHIYMDQGNIIQNQETQQFYQQQPIISQIPIQRTQNEINQKVPQFAQYTVPQSVSYVINRPGDNTQNQSQLNQTNLIQQGQVNSQIKSTQPYQYPTQISFGEFGDLLQQAHNQEMFVQPQEQLQVIQQHNNQQRSSISPIVNAKSSFHSQLESQHY